MVLTPDIRGVFKSGGDYLFWGKQSARDGYDFVEWAAEQEWSNGRFAFTGNSQLSILQWFIAAERPPHLTAIAPWEALIDMYRNDVCIGGIPDTAFNESIISETYGQGRIEDVPAMLERYPLFNEYWAEKIAAVENIGVPAYVVGSWTNPVHSRGTLQAWQRLRTEERWLRVHNTMEWPDYYSPESVADLRRFFDHYLKGVDNGWEATPRVRLSVLDPGGQDTVNRAYGEFPPPQARHRALYLDGATGSLVDALPEAESTVRYTADDNSSVAALTYRFDHDAEIIGHVSMRLWVEAEGHDDADIHVWVRKLDADAKPLSHIVIPLPDPAKKAFLAAADLKPVSRRMPASSRYNGPWGRQRASLRALDHGLSTTGLPIHAMTRSEKLAPGQIVPVDISLWPTGLRFHRGEQLRLQIAGFNMRGPNLAGLPEADNQNRGTHIIHTGGQFDSHLLLPFAPGS